LDKYRPLYKQKNRRNYKTRPSRRVLVRSRRLRGHHNAEKERVIWTTLGFVGVVAMILSIVFLIWLQRIAKELPAVNRPEVQASSIIYDRNGVELYRINSPSSQSDWITTSDYVPELQKWAFLAGEDADFYIHGGVDFTAIIRCVITNIATERRCGGSTISQQTIVNTLLVRENTYIRKIKEILLALQLERLYEKDEIMNIYLNVVPQGSNIKGIKRGADFYYKKKLDELTIEEMVVLAAVVQDPNGLSPTVGSNLESNRERLYYRTDYILDQMSKNIDRINERIKLANERNKDKEDFPLQEEITKDDLNNAKDKVRELEFQRPAVVIKAPHFVFYVQKLLQDSERGYNKGEAFKPGELQTGGLKIYTTLDYSLQEVAEKYVGSNEFGHAGYYRNNYNAANSALMTIRPSTGEVLTMVGSKCYTNNQYIPDCEELNESEGKKFDSDVNVLDTLQSPGSTNKAVGYYVGFRDGIISTGSVLPDVPINSIPGYRPKNWNGAFSGYGNVRDVFARSLNIPALFLIESFGVQKFIDASRDFGYTTYTNPNGYGPSVVLGGGDIKAIEHAQAFGVFANGGDFVQHEVVSKITDVDGNVLYEHKPKRISIADSAAVYLVNNVLNPRTTGSIAPPKHMLDRDVAGKTGTSENNRDTWFVMWSPEFVTVGWMGNNDNTPMSSQAFGSTSVEPWVGSFMDAVASAFPDKTPFARPSGVISVGGQCDDEGCISEVGLGIAGKVAPNYMTREDFIVCTDQPDKLARPVDIASGFAFSKSFVSLKSPVAKMQGDVDAFLSSKGLGAPYEFCDISRDVNMNIPQIIITSPRPGETYKDTLPIDVNAYIQDERSISEISVEVDGRQVLGSSSETSVKNSIDISSYGNGVYTINVKVVDSEGFTNSRSVRINIGSNDRADGTLNLSGPSEVDPNSSNMITVNYVGDYNIRNVKLYQVNFDGGPVNFVGDMREITSGRFEYRWLAPSMGTYNIYAVAEENRMSLSSPTLQIKINSTLDTDN
jgi:penicillin-binding protein 1A